MSSEYDRRATIIVCTRNGRTPVEISDFTGIPLPTVYAVVKRFKEAEQEEGAGTPARKKHDRSSQKKRDDDFVSRLQSMVDEDPSVSMRSLAARLDVSEWTVRTAVHEDLRCRSYQLKVRQMLSPQLKERRLAKCHLLLTSLKHEAAGRLRFFSDEKIFTVDAKVNRRNDRWIALDPSEVPVVGKTKNPASVHVLLVVSSDGHVMPPFFFKKGESVTKEVYLDALVRHVKPWMTATAAGRSYVFQQDGAPAHTSHLVQNWVSDELDMAWTKEFWPPSSPDLNPLDYYVWGVLERETNKRAHNNTDSLRDAIEEATANMNTVHLVNACQRFRARVEAAIQAEGGWFE